MTFRTGLNTLRFLVLWTALAVSGTALGNPDPELLLLKVTVNGTQQGTSFVLRDASGVYYADPGALAAWGVRGPYARPVEMHGREFHPFSAADGVGVIHDAAEMTLVVDFPPALMNGQSTVAYLDGTPAPAATGAAAAGQSAAGAAGALSRLRRERARQESRRRAPPARVAAPPTPPRSPGRARRHARTGGYARRS